jgi:hypothetical protein
MTKWISVEDDKPKDEQMVMVVYKGDVFPAVYYCPEHSSPYYLLWNRPGTIDSGESVYEVYFWMPKPELPDNDLPELGE